jgi:hypothetical protein
MGAVIRIDEPHPELAERTAPFDEATGLIPDFGCQIGLRHG